MFGSRGGDKSMEIVILVILFFVGTVASALQAMKYLERRQHLHQPRSRRGARR
jgi:hypothetical protein